MPEPILSLAIVTFKRAELLRQLLASVAAQSHPFAHVVVWDNDPDGSAEAVCRSFGFQQAGPLRYARSERNLGGAGGFARAIAAALEQPDWTVLVTCDDDISLRADFVETVERYAAEHPRHAAVPSRRYADGRAFDWGPRLAGPFVTRIARHCPPTSTPQEVDLLTFEGCALPRAALDSAGLPDAAFFIDGDDWEYGLRIRAHGFTIARLPEELVVRHLPPPVRQARGLGTVSERAGLTALRTYYEIRNKFEIMYRHSKNKPAEALWLVWQGLRRGAGAVLYEREKAGFVRAIARGVLHGLIRRQGPLTH